MGGRFRLDPSGRRLNMTTFRVFIVFLQNKPRPRKERRVQLLPRAITVFKTTDKRAEDQSDGENSNGYY